MTVPGLSVIWM